MVVSVLANTPVLLKYQTRSTLAIRHCIWHRMHARAVAIQNIRRRLVQAALKNMQLPRHAMLRLYCHDAFGRLGGCLKYIGFIQRDLVFG